MQFADIVGQNAIKEKLNNAFRNNRVPHSLLFLGPEGSASFPLALAFAQYLLCNNPTETDSCGTCSSCIQNAKLIHPDLHFSFPFFSKEKLSLAQHYYSEWRTFCIANPYPSEQAWLNFIRSKDDENKLGNISSAECHQIKKTLSLSAYSGGNKVMFIWLPEYFNTEGNILLKSIEEPSEDTYFIMIAENYELILPTIVSRTQLIKVNAFKIDEIKNHLISKQIAQDLAEKAAILCKGNLALALEFCEEEDDIDFNEILRKWFQLCYKMQLGKLTEWVSEVSSKGRSQRILFLEAALILLRECLNLKINEAYNLKLNSQQQEFAKNFSKAITLQQIELMYKNINDYIYYNERNANAKITLFNLSLKLCKIFANKDELIAI